MTLHFVRAAGEVDSPDFRLEDAIVRLSDEAFETAERRAERALMLIMLVGGVVVAGVATVLAMAAFSPCQGLIGSLS